MRSRLRHSIAKRTISVRRDHGVVGLTDAVPAGPEVVPGEDAAPQAAAKKASPPVIPRAMNRLMVRSRMGAGPGALK